MSTTDVLAELDAEIEFRKTVFAIGVPELERLQSIRTRIAALVEAARVFDIEMGAHLPDDDLVKFNNTVGEYRALSIALKAIGHG